MTNPPDSTVKILWNYAKSVEDPLEHFPQMVIEGVPYNEYLCRHMDDAFTRWRCPKKMDDVVDMLQYLLLAVDESQKVLHAEFGDADAGFYSAALYLTNQATRSGTLFAVAIMKGMPMEFHPVRSHAGLVTYTKEHQALVDGCDAKKTPAFSAKSLRHKYVPSTEAPKAGSPNLLVNNLRMNPKSIRERHDEVLAKLRHQITKLTG